MSGYDDDDDDDDDEIPPSYPHPREVIPGQYLP